MAHVFLRQHENIAGVFQSLAFRDELQTANFSVGQQGEIGLRPERLMGIGHRHCGHCWEVPWEKAMQAMASARGYTAIEKKVVNPERQFLIVRRSTTPSIWKWRVIQK